jgi:hypothetical protein
MVTLPQRNFAGGEVSEAILARADVQKHGTAVARMHNMFPERSGAASNRAGTQYINEVKDSTATPGEDIDPQVAETLIDFVFNREEAYVLEFGQEYVRPYRRGQPVYLAPSAYNASADYTPGDTVRSGGIDWYCLEDNGVSSSLVTPGNDLTVWYELPTPPDHYGGDATSFLEIPTPYDGGQITKQNVAQSADILTITHREHGPRELQRLTATKWVLLPVAYVPTTVTSPVLGTVTTQNDGEQVLRLMVTAIAKDTFEESVVGHRSTSTTSNITSAGDEDILIDAASHGLETGDRIYISACTPSAEKNDVLVQALEGRDFFITDDPDNAGDAFYLDDTAGIDYTFAHSVTWHLTHLVLFTQGGPERKQLTWTPVDNALEYTVYGTAGGDNGIFGYMGTSKKAEFFWELITPDYEEQPPHYITRFERADKHPHTASYFQQRLCYAQSTDEPQAVWMSRTGAFRNFATRSPLVDDDAVVFTVSGKQVNEVRHLIGMDQLLVLTLGTQNAVTGDADGVITPDAINMRTHGYNGASNVRPVTLGSEAIFIQARRSIVRSIGFEATREAYDGGDLTLFANHLTDSRELTDMAYAQTPHSIVWVLREDGVLLGLTYIRDQEIAGWHWHVTYTSEGTVASEIKSIAVIPEDGQDLVYMIVERVIDGETVRYIEKMVRRCTAWDLSEIE